MSIKTARDGSTSAHGRAPTRVMMLHAAEWDEALQAGQQRAATVGHPILVSLTQAADWGDPIQRFALDTAAFFWEQPAQHRALVGTGIAAEIATTGPCHIADAAQRWRDLLRDAHTITAPDVAAAGPVLFGGFAFDPLHPHTDLWAGFPDGLLIVPASLWRYDAGQVTLTRSQLVGVAPPLASPQLRMERSTSDRMMSGQGLGDAAWQQLVADTAEQIRAGAYEKVVLARAETVRQAAAFDIPSALHDLREHYSAATIFAVRRGTSTFMGATPERLARVQDRQITTMALAGSAPRGTTPTQDATLSEEFLHSAKIHAEHAIVIDSILADLAQHCVSVQAADQPRLLKLKNVQHLETPISGELLPDRSILDVVATLHPTPAVGGFPRIAALAAIRAGEGMDRGWYAGPLGWLDAAGDGEFVVALRSALVQGNAATLFAGCGIVGDSDPASELAESRLKLHVMLRALGDEA